MKQMGNYIFIGMMFLLSLSCERDDGSGDPIPTGVTGRVFDSERARPYVATKMNLNSAFHCGTGFTSGTCYELIGTTFTDEDGRYSFDFDYEEGKRYYVTRDIDYITYPQEISLDYLSPGANNVTDFDFWRPLVFILNLELTNNDNPPLKVRSRDEDDFYLEHVFPILEVNEQTFNSTLYLLGKPNANMRISFDYSSENGDYHEIREFVQTSVQDSLAVSFSVDCNTF